MAVLKGQKNEIAVRVTAVIEEDLGKELRVPFVAIYRKLRSSERREVMQQIDAGQIDDFEILDRHLVGWRDLEGNGGEVAFSPENLDQVKEHPDYLKALIEGFFVAQLGKKAVRKKN